MDVVSKTFECFTHYVQEVFTTILKRPVPPEANNLLSKGHLAMIAMLKLLIRAGQSEQDIQALILSNLNIKRTDLPADVLAKLQRYSEYFHKVASL